MVEHTDAALVAEGALKGLCKAHECREERQWSYWGLSQLLSVFPVYLRQESGRQQSEMLSEMGSQSPRDEPSEGHGWRFLLFKAH